MSGTVDLPTGLGVDTPASVSSAINAALAYYAPLASPALTGAPTAPTAASGTNTTQVATTAFVQTAVGSGGSSGVTSVASLTGVVTAAELATALDGTLAPLASPALTGTPTAPTASAGTDTMQVSTTAFVASAVAVETARAEAAEALKAPLASPTLTGVPAAPTAASGTDTTQIATTAFVTSAVTSGAGAFTPLTGAITAPGCYIVKLYGTTTSTTALRLTTDGSGVASSSNVANLPAGYMATMQIDGGAHDATGTVSYFPYYVIAVQRIYQRTDAGTISLITTAGGTATSATGYGLNVAADTTLYGINITATAANSDTTNWAVYLTIRVLN